MPLVDKAQPPSWGADPRSSRPGNFLLPGNGFSSTLEDVGQCPVPIETFVSEWEGGVSARGGGTLLDTPHHMGPLLLMPWRDVRERG